jgi:hypothetical protein
MNDLPPILPGTPPANAARSGQLRFHGRAGDLFHQGGLKALLCGITVVGLPYASVLFYRWIARKTETINGNRFTFKGGAGTLYALFGCQIATVVLFHGHWLADFFSPVDFPSDFSVARVLVTLVQFFVNGLIGYWYLRYFIANLEDSQGRKLDFRVPMLGYAGLAMVLPLTLLTIIGWAWFFCWLYRWIFRHVHLEGATIHFRGTGFSLLWRTVVSALCFLPIVTIPWSIAWLYGWLISQVEIRHESLPAI